MIKQLHIFMMAICLSFFAFPLVRAADLFDPEEPIVDGLDVFKVSDVFADIYEKLDGVKWAGKDMRVALESLEKLHPNAHVALTDDRAVVVWKDAIIGNWPKPTDGDWKGYGQITTSILLKLRQADPALGALAPSDLYATVVGVLMSGIDENGRYILSRAAQISEDGRLVTSAGLEGVHDENGNFRITGIYKGSVADNVGIREGDLVFDINGRAANTMSTGDIAAELAGFNSGTVKMTIADALNGMRTVVLRRASIMMADADVIVKTPLLEIVVHRISDNAVSIINEALTRYGGDAGGIILDLRAATGEDEKAAAKIAGLFMGRVPVLRIVETAFNETEVIPGGSAVVDTAIPVVVLTSAGTRGTAEALAAAFYENMRGVLVGTPTAGRARLATMIDLKNGGGLELFNREAKTGAGRKIDGRGVFPIVCLSTIRNSQQREAFFLNVINGDFNARDMNRDEGVDTEAARRGCPQITSGADEDAASAAVAAYILTGDRRVYGGLITGGDSRTAD